LSATTAPAPQTEHEPENSLAIVWRLAWPAVALNSLQTLNALLDSSFVGSLEPAALTALGGATPFIFLLVSLSFAFGTAATALVARAYGAGEREQFIKSNRQCISLSLVGGFLLALLAIPLGHFASQSMLPEGATRAAALMLQFMAIFAFSLPAIFIVQTLAGSLRGIGDTKSPMYISGIQILVHILLNFLLIFPSRDWKGITIPGAGMGIQGAALGLTLSAWIAAAIYLAWSARTPLGQSWSLALPNWLWTKRILNIALPAAMMSIVRVTSLMAFTYVLSHVPQGEAAIAAMRVGFSIEAFAFMPAFGLAIAASALVGQSLGMGRPDRAERLGWTAAHQAAIVSLVISVGLFLYATPIAQLILPSKPEMAAIAAQYVVYIAATEILFAYGMVMVGGLQGAGDTVRPLWLTIFSMWLIRVPMAAFLALPAIGPIKGMNLGSDGCWMAMSITQVVQGVLAMIVFRQGKWKSQVV